MAITTGKCQTNKSTPTTATAKEETSGHGNPHTDIYRAVQRFGNFKNFCPNYQVNVPE